MDRLLRALFALIVSAGVVGLAGCDKKPETKKDAPAADKPAADKPAADKPAGT